MTEYEKYTSIRDANRRIFEHNFAPDIAAFQSSFGLLRSAWAVLGSNRDTAGKSHVGLLLFANMLVRHCIFGFENLACFQSYLAWSNFRSGLEALLILGKLVDDPANALVWANRASNSNKDKNAYRKLFTGPALESNAIARSKELRQVHSRLNDEFMHPNPFFTYRDAKKVEDGKDNILQIELFDDLPELHEANLLAYLNLVSIIVEESTKLVHQLCGVGDLQACRNLYGAISKARAVKLVASASGAKEILTEFGLWQL
jgi:hypothetical protein